MSLFINDKIDLPALLTVQCRIIAEHQLKNNLLIDALGTFISEELLAENRQTPEEKEQIEKTDGLMPWVAGKLSTYHVEFLARERGMDKEQVQLGLVDGGGWFLGMCAGIVHDENHYEKTGDDKFNPARREMARMFLATYDRTEDGWVNKHASPGTGAEINGVHIAMPDYTQLNDGNNDE